MTRMYHTYCYVDMCMHIMYSIIIIAGPAFYITWGSNQCANKEQTSLYIGSVYTGRNANSADSDYICLPSDLSAAPTPAALLIRNANLTLQDTNNADGIYIACVACLITDRSIVVTLPGKSICPTGFNVEYAGYLAANPRSPGNNICVHANAGVDLVKRPSDTLAVIMKGRGYSADAVACAVCSI